VSEVAAERAVARAYVDAAERVNAPRTFLERIGLIGSADPEAQLAVANGRFAEGELRAAANAIAEVERIVDAAAGSGLVRLASLAVVLVLAIVLTVVAFRRRAYTARR
jgi:hypothetical protein